MAETFVRRNVPPPDPTPLISTVVRERINRVLRRRLSDRVLDIFQEACVSGDLATAEELLEVIEAMQRRRQAAMPDRRLSNEEVVRARDELVTRKAGREALLAGGAEAD